MTHDEAQALAQIARRLLRAEHISTVEAHFIQTVIERSVQPAAPLQQEPGGAQDTRTQAV